MSIIEARLNSAEGFPSQYRSIALTPTDCRQIVETFRAELANEKWLLSTERDISDMSAEKIKLWLRRLPLKEKTSIVWIGFDEGINLAFPDFIHFYDDLWFPGSDDILISSSDHLYTLTISHEEIISLYQSCEL